MSPLKRSICRQGERGAALLTVLMMSLLLLSAGLALIVSTSMSATTAIDSTAEMQAYFASEAGIDATIDILRGNVAPDASLAGTKINFRNAANPTTSNRTNDSLRTGANATARLSGWLNYAYQNPALANDWRVPLTNNYAPLTGIAFRVTIADPDDPGPIATRKITTDPNYRPLRLLIHSEGFGPKGAIKRLEVILRAGSFEFDPPATLTLPGDPVNLAFGDSSEVEYSGVDLGNPPIVGKGAIAVDPGSVGTTVAAIDALHDGSQVSPGDPTALSESNTPSFLQSTDAARAFLNEMRAIADGAGRLFPSKAAADAAGGLGTSENPKLTFIDNYGTDAVPGEPVTLGPNHQGSGLLIVTGVLDTDGTTDFEGIILVLGRGILTRSGGGKGLMQGAVVVAQFDPYGKDDAFGAPTFKIDGGGTSRLAYNSSWINKALEMSGVTVTGIREYH